MCFTAWVPVPMMARAMSTGHDERLPYRELAGQGARIVRQMPAESLRRLVVLAPGRRDLSVDMTFSLDAERRPWVRGSAEVSVAATCQRCLERVDRDLSVAFELCILADSALASELAREADVVVADAEAVTIAELVEDELLLALPERLCPEEPCPHAPALSYPAAEASGKAAEENPFHVLSELKR